MLRRERKRRRRRKNVSIRRRDVGWMRLLRKVRVLLPLLRFLFKVLPWMKMLLRQIGDEEAVEMIRREDDRIQEGRLFDDLVHDEVRRRRRQIR